MHNRSGGDRAVLVLGTPPPPPPTPLNRLTWNWITPLLIWMQNHSGGDSVVLDTNSHSLTFNRQALKWLTPLPIWMQNHSVGDSVTSVTVNTPTSRALSGARSSPVALRRQCHCSQWLQLTGQSSLQLQQSSVQFKMLSRRSEKSICAPPPRLSEVSPTLIIMTLFVFDLQSWDVSMVHALHVWVVLIVPGCVHVCLRFAVGVGSSSVCMFHVLILMFILALNCE